MSPETEETRTLVVVDDDELILSSLRSLFSLETDYTLLTFSDPHEATEKIKTQRVDLILSDFLMPTMSGIDFLKQARNLQPEAPRILLTGFADKANAIRAINEVGLYHYLEKPWDNEELLILVRHALEEKSLRQDLSEKIKALNRLMKEHGELASRHKSLEKEVEMAARVQRSLLPENFPQVRGFEVNVAYRPSVAVGGDYYDVSSSDGRVIWLLADVTGHGIQAALTSMLLKAIFQETASRASHPVQLLADMNSRLHRFLPEGMFAAATVVELGADGHHVQIANAGLPYPFVLCSGQEADVHQIPLSGLPLGLFPQAGPDHFDTRELEINRGDHLLVTSDGLGESRGHNGEFFEENELPKSLAELTDKDGSYVVQNLVERAIAFGGTDGISDDISLVAVTGL